MPSQVSGMSRVGTGSWGWGGGGVQSLARKMSALEFQQDSLACLLRGS